MNFFDHKDLGNHLLQLGPKVVKHPVFGKFIFPKEYIFPFWLRILFCHRVLPTRELEVVYEFCYNIFYYLRKLIFFINTYSPENKVYFHVSYFAFPISQSSYQIYPAFPSLTSKFRLHLFHGRCFLLYMHLIQLGKLCRIFPSKALEDACLGRPCTTGAFLVFVRFYVERGAYKMFIF